MHDLIDFAAGELDAIKATPAAVLDRFCHHIGHLLETAALSDVPRSVAALLPDLLRQPNLLTPSQRSAPADTYGRNRVFICPQDKFSVLAMVWPAGVTTPIHDHRDWCAVGVYENLIEETYYSPASEAADCVTAVPDRTVRHQPGAISHLPVDAPNIHSIHNPTDKVAISIHVYGGNCETLGPNLGKVYTVTG
jgi:predicted metal-dependent enzyme (double-stranded beta helix superfamily)